MEYLEWVLFALGVSTLLPVISHLSIVFFSLKGGTDLSKYRKGTWAVVTGATDGIGLGFARQLAQKGFKVVLVSRNPQKLEKVASALTEEFKVEVKVVVRDFAECVKNPVEYFRNLVGELEDLDISILVNNVGMGSPGRLHRKPLNKVLDTNALNLWPVVLLTKLLLPKLQKAPSLIVNLSSVASITPICGSSVYCATKSYDDLFSLFLREELKYRSSGIDVVSLQPAYVDTPLTQDIKGKFLEISADECAAKCLEAADKVGYTSGHWKHQVVSSLIRSFSGAFSYFSSFRASKKPKTN